VNLPRSRYFEDLYPLFQRFASPGNKQMYNQEFKDQMLVRINYI